MFHITIRLRPAIWAAALLLAACLMAGMISATVKASGFRDVDGHWGSAAIQWAVSAGVVDGYADGTFRPDRPVTEAEFLTMLLRAYNNAQSVEASPWYAGSYSLAEQLNWPVERSRANDSYSRGHVARLLAASQGHALSIEDSIQFLYDNDLSQGKTAKTITGFAQGDTLNRAEAVQFIRNVTELTTILKSVPAAEHPLSVRGVALGDSAASAAAKLGPAARQDESEYGFKWHIYNEDYSRYAQVGIQDGRVVALYTNSAEWVLGSVNLRPGDAAEQVVGALGEPLQWLLKNNTRYMLIDPGVEDALYEIEDAYVTFYYDTHERSEIDAVLIVSKQVEQSRTSMYGPASTELAAAYERGVFDLANAARVQRGLAPFEWDDAIAATARKHSEDMARSEYFDHENKAGLSPFDRMESDGIAYRLAAENIAAGQTNAISAHASWMNSKSGHRESILGRTTRLGVGVYFGGPMHIYFTQNFFTPLNGTP